MDNRLKATLTLWYLVFILLFGAIFIGIPGGSTNTSQVIPLTILKNHNCVTTETRGVIVNTRRPNRTLPTTKLILDRQAARAGLTMQMTKLPAKARTKRAQLAKRILVINSEISEIQSCATGQLHVQVEEVATCGNGVLDEDEVCDPSVAANSQCCTLDCNAQPLGTSCSIADTSPTQCEMFACNGAGACTVQNREGDCDDKQECTRNDKCIGRSCVGAPVDPSEDRAITCGEGECKRSVMACSTNPVCTPGVPTQETCNGLDDDCDGQIDEALGTISCGKGSCAQQVPACVDGTPQTCSPKSGTGEVCNGIDDDCDGAVDEDLGNISCGRGICQRLTPACINGKTAQCIPGPAINETCNSVDDDCDGEVDEGLGTITCGTGSCLKISPACVAGVPASCGELGTLNPARPEVCNGIDDNCNNQIDELAPLECGVGACKRSTAACWNGAANRCTPGAPTAETCNGIDDDCNGVIDNQAICPSSTNTQGWCYSGRCSYTCAAGFADGNQNVADGCEIDLRNDINNCGAVGKKCSTSEVCKQPVCTQGQCSSAPGPEGTACLSVSSGKYGCDGEYIYGPGNYACDKYGSCVGGPKMRCTQIQCSTWFGCTNRCSLFVPDSCGPGFVCTSSPFVPGLTQCVVRN